MPPAARELSEREADARSAALLAAATCAPDKENVPPPRDRAAGARAFCDPLLAYRELVRAEAAAAVGDGTECAGCAEGPEGGKVGKVGEAADAGDGARKALDEVPAAAPSAGWREMLADAAERAASPLTTPAKRGDGDRRPVSSPLPRSPLEDITRAVVGTKASRRAEREREAARAERRSRAVSERLAARPPLRMSMR